MINKNTRGSQWKKWDLHIHTPETVKADEFKTESDIWETYISKLENNKEIAVFGITDYFSMDNYNKLKKCQSEGRLGNKLLLPNVELRILPVTSEDIPINLHIIFDDKLDYEEIEREFFRKLNFKYGESTYSCIKKDIIKLGKVYKGKPDLDDKTAYFEGINQYNVPFQDIKTVLNNDNLKGRFLVGVSNSNKDGNSGIQESALTATRREIYRLSNFIFSGNPNDINYFSGKGRDNTQKVIDDYGSLKPCITGCDAHSFEKMFLFPENRYTWIKADMSFEGLKQIIYEPLERIKIQETIPEEKPDYLIIESITLDNELFGKQTIEFNQNLNSIIGGRSSGKSVLLGCLAKLTGFHGEIKNNNPEYNAWISEISKSSIIKWKDDNPDTDRKIDYFGQSQINLLTSNTDEVNNIVESIIRMNEDKKNNLDSYTKFEINNKTDIINKINEWCSQRQQIVDLNSQIEEIGSEKGIETQVKKIKNEIETIKKQIPSTLSEEEEKTFSKSKDKLLENNNQKKIISLDISGLTVLKDFNYFNEIDSAISSLSSNIHDEVELFYLETKKAMKEKIDIFINNKILEMEQNTNNLTKQSEKIVYSDIYKKGEQYFSDNTMLLEKEKQLKAEQEKLNEITMLKKERDLISKSWEKIKASILDMHLKYYKKLLEISKNLQMQKDDVHIASEINFSNDRFKEIIRGVLNQRTGDGKYYIDFKYTTIEEYIKITNDIFNKVDNGKILLKSDIQQVLISILSENCFSLNYKVNYDNDDLNSMSEGKKAFIILRLLLDFGEKDWPILIDQPEDDLDNRAIYDQLVMYLRLKKKQRQIILVTHNPNIVVAADSELVIVANQNGIKNKNQENVKFEYFASSIETTFKDNDADTILLSQGIREHVCDILEGGDKAFQIREQRYGYK